MDSPLNFRFSPTTKAQWQAQVQKDLKTSTTTGGLNWITPDGFLMESYYTAEDLTHLPLESVQAAQTSKPGWLNTPALGPDPVQTNNTSLQDEIRRGADALLLDLTGQPNPVENLSRLLNGIKLSNTPIYFRLDTNITPFINSLKTVAPYQLKGGLLVDPLARWMQMNQAPDEPLVALGDATRQTATSPQFRTITGSSHVFHNAGATATQELAFLLASLTDQYDALTDQGLPVELLIAKTTLSVSVGTSYFTEIAKLRALRVLWQRFTSAYSTPENPISSPAFIHAQTSIFYDAALVPYTNLIRATTEAITAVLGGCDMLTVHPYDAVSGQTRPHAERSYADRIARNVSLLLKEESYLDKVTDPSAGSYYIETLTHQLVEAAWALFLRTEEMGGLIEAFKQGFIQTELDQSYQTRVDALKAEVPEQGRVMVGVNKFRVDELRFPVQAAVNSPTTAQSFSLLTTRRLAESFEHQGLL